MKFLLIALFSCLTLTAQAKTDQEFVSDIYKNVNVFRFRHLAGYGNHPAELIVTSSGVSLNRRSGIREFDREILRAANEVYDESVTAGLIIPVSLQGGRIDTTWPPSPGGSLFTRERSPF